MSTHLLEKELTEGIKGKVSHYFFHKDRIEKELARSIAGFGEKNKLRDACEYALTNGGKRFRPLIVLMIAEALGLGLDVAPTALAVEFFHTASLIVDDLPCMDNEEERRGKPSLHKVFGENVALLTTYSLIAAGFEKIEQNTLLLREAGEPFSKEADHAGIVALGIATRCAGISGAAGGQFLDLFPPNTSLDTLLDVIQKKTVTLFEGAFSFGWIFGGGDLSRLGEIKKLSYHFGMAFQIADDIQDYEQDEKNERMISMARLIGKERALIVFKEEIKQYVDILKTLGLYTPTFAKMADLMLKKASKEVGD